MVTDCDDAYLVKVRRKYELGETDGNEAARAILSAIKVMIEYEICTLDQFLQLIDHRNCSYWDISAMEMAKKAEPWMRKGKDFSKKMKPWQSCAVNYRDEFFKISNDDVWRRLNAALNSINNAVQELYSSKA